MANTGIDRKALQEMHDNIKDREVLQYLLEKLGWLNYYESNYGAI